MEKLCKYCGKPVGKRGMDACYGCYRYYKDGGTENIPPPPGTIAYDINGKVICHICGRAYKRLGSHARETHNMTIDEYKEVFGLCRRTKTTSDTYSAHMHSLAIFYRMDDQLLEVGKNTRIKSGQTDMRKGKSVRLQEVLDKRNRGKTV